MALSVLLGLMGPMQESVHNSATFQRKVPYHILLKPRRQIVGP
eukprot:CAMPEP_0179425774 /NCGR_PEP_ID=MMETSP0799-20121207/12361_1 /TAXON_ID=46947 /ORGANISM="Geminigera cryophila, Strain CCMP2564" /LENGTH=42 /DNA_ID= /DNA_START= /DNA_END= /DNA_ORIENTATION=